MGQMVLDKYPGDCGEMPSHIEKPEAAACKWESLRKKNREKFDLDTGFWILIYTVRKPESHSPSATAATTR